ncbi:helix-turn-helix domain-containing protein [Hymenobacter sp. BT175]|uniref:helix-turn-helix domain-containing protein n=1 Tax=Hymenobacter translucens TaxID=2886507 RepID=UPI001D0F0629|nr:helix-turn-helix domain-containing protein [Hymenobacter translucens]MCC2545529.1 helix-turn-helix domain-containing protein [Hymenobacter translucens]
MNHLVRIKGMVCPRCIQTVSAVFRDEDFPVTDVQLGAVTYHTGNEQPRDLARVRQRLAAEGFEVLDDKQARLIARLKELVDAWIEQGVEHEHTLAAYVSEALHQNYYTLSTLFSATQGTTLERYLISRRIELAQQQLETSDESLAVIGERLGFSSSHHFSNQFKRETGLTPSQYRVMKRAG